MINSQVSQYIQLRDRLWHTQVKIEVSTHPFLSYDSWADFSNLIDDFSFKDIEEQILKDYSRIKGEICEDKKSEILLAIESSPTLSGRHKQSILNSLSPPKTN